MRLKVIQGSLPHHERGACSSHSKTGLLKEDMVCEAGWHTLPTLIVCSCCITSSGTSIVAGVLCATPAKQSHKRSGDGF